MAILYRHWSPAAPRSSAAVWPTLAWLLLCCTWGPAVAKGGVWSPPDLAGFLLFAEEEADGDGDGTKETQIRRYRNSAGDSIFSMTTKGRLWAWSLESGPAGGTDPSHNYVIRDSDCDGVFDELYGLSDQFQVPDCLK